MLQEDEQEKRLSDLKQSIQDLKLRLSRKDQQVVDNMMVIANRNENITVKRFQEHNEYLEGRLADVTLELHATKMLEPEEIEKNTKGNQKNREEWKRMTAEIGGLKDLLKQREAAFLELEKSNNVDEKDFKCSYKLKKRNSANTVAQKDAQIARMAKMILVIHF